MPSQDTLNAEKLGELQRMDAAVSPAEQDVIITSREHLYGQVSLETNDVICGDDREPIDYKGLYIHWFGGELNPVYGLNILKEATQPGSVTGSWEQSVESTVPILRDVAGVSGGVHSDDTCEGDGKLKVDQADGDVGCGYALLRSDISELIVARRQLIIADAMNLQPELFESPQDIKYANDTIDAHDRLTKLDGFFTTGRGVVLTAIKQGAKPVVVRGKHTATTGIINEDASSSFDTGQAIKENLPAYDHDAGSLNEAYDRIHHLYPYDKRLRRIAGLIDTIGTMRALGVTDIAVRRAK